MNIIHLDCVTINRTIIFMIMMAINGKLSLSMLRQYNKVLCFIKIIYRTDNQFAELRKMSGQRKIKKNGWKLVICATKLTSCCMCVHLNHLLGARISSSAVPFCRALWSSCSVWCVVVKQIINIIIVATRRWYMASSVILAACVCVCVLCTPISSVMTNVSRSSSQTAHQPSTKHFSVILPPD